MTLLKRINFFKSRRSLFGDRRGIAAIEFAFIAPIIVLVLLASVDSVFALTAKRKMALATHTIADLTARLEDASDGDIVAIGKLGRLIMTPFDVTESRIWITHAQVNGDGATADVAFSEAQGPGATPIQNGSTVNLPSELTPGAWVAIIRTELPYSTLLGFLETLIGDNITFTLSEEAYFQTRSGEEICRNGVCTSS